MSARPDLREEGWALELAEWVAEWVKGN